jgi:hypothetical protein
MNATAIPAHHPEANPERFEDWRQEQLAEQSYVDVLAHPETIVDAAANGAHVAWDAYTPYHEVGECPNAGETVDGAWNACAATYPSDVF